MKVYQVLLYRHGAHTTVAIFGSQKAAEEYTMSLVHLDMEIVEFNLDDLERAKVVVSDVFDDNPFL